MFERGFETPKPSPNVDQHTIESVSTQTPESIRLFVAESYNVADIDSLNALMQAILERITEIDDQSSPSEVGELESSYGYVAMHRDRLRAQLDDYQADIEAMLTNADKL